MTILEKILRTKGDEVREARRRVATEELRRACRDLPLPRDFRSAVLSGAAGEVRLIAEIKKASPSAGLILRDFDPVRIARVYAAHGASAISVLTDESHFHGHLSHIGEVRQGVALPVLRKDFIIDEYQIYESRAAEADAILLIAAVLRDVRLVEFARAARDLGLTCLVEVHDEAELQRVLTELGSPESSEYILGINNRDLHAQRTDLETTVRLAALLPAGTRFITESGIASWDDVNLVRGAGAGAMLVGEALLRAPEMGTKIRELLGR